MAIRPIIARPIEYDDALITSVVRYGEKDCIVRLFTKNSGRISAFFKQGLSLKKGNGSVQTPALSRVGLVASHQKLARLVSSDLDPKALQLASSLRVFGYQTYIAELIEKFLPEEDPAPEVFMMVEEAYEVLLERGAEPCILRAFELKLLDYCGYLPEFPYNHEEEQDVIAFDPITQRFTSVMEEGHFFFSPDALLLAKSMLIAKIGRVNYEGMVELLMIGRVFQNRLRLMGIGSLKSVAFLKQLS